MTKRKELFRASAALATLLALGACSSDLSQSPVPDAESPTLSAQATALPDIRIADSAGDAEQLFSGSVLTASPVLELGTRSDGQQTVGLRFSGVAVPRGSDIVSAYVDFYASSNHSSVASLRIQGLAETNPQPFTATANNVSSRARTAASVTWTPEDWIGGRSEPYTTVNIANVVEEIVRRSDWPETAASAQNAALALVITANTGSGLRQAHSWDASNTLQPVLRITYNPPVAALPSCLSGKTNPRFYSGSGTGPVVIQGLPNSTNGAAELTGQSFEGSHANDTEPITIRVNNPNLCVSGGSYTFTDIDDEETWHPGGPVMYVNRSKALTIERIAIINAVDGLGVAPTSSTIPADHADGLKLTDSYIRHANDDAIENDVKASFTLNNTLIDWAYTGMSCRGGSRTTPGAFRITNTLFALKKQASGFPSGGQPRSNVYFNPFKWEVSGKTPCPLYLNNVTIYMEQDEDSSGGNALFNSDFRPSEIVKECRNVTLLFGGDNYYSGTRKAQIDDLRAKFRTASDPTGEGCLKLVQGAAARQEWNARRQAWFNRLPSAGFEHIKYYQNRDPKPQ